MESRTAGTAERLHSVALRYRRPTGAWSGGQPGGRRGVWFWARMGGSPGAPPANGAGLQREGRLRRVEAVLFLAREPIASRRLSEHANLADGTEARTLIRRLKRLYDQSGRAFRVEEVAGGFQLLCRPEFAPWLRRLEHVPPETRLSAPAMETLAVVAYRQPAARSEIEAIRGVGCGEVLRQLMERGLVRISGRSEELGRPYLYATTKRFLQLFGLQSLDKLPRAELLRGVSTGRRKQDTVSEEKSTVRLEREHPEESEVSATPISPFPIDGSVDEALEATPAAPRQSIDDDGDECDYDEYDYDEDEDEKGDENDEESEEEEDFDEDLEEDLDEDLDEDEEEEEEDLEDEEEEDLEDEEWEEVGDDEEEEGEEEEEEDWDDEDPDWEEEEEEEEDDEDWQ